MKRLVHFSLIAAAALYLGACGGSTAPTVVTETGTGVEQDTGLSVSAGMEGVVEGTGVVVATEVTNGEVVDTGDAAGDTDEVLTVDTGKFFRVTSPVYKSLFMPANNGATGVELFQVDLENLSALPTGIDIRAGAVGSFPAEMIEVDGKIYMSANDGVNGRELWIYDGTTGIARIWNINVNTGNGSDPRFLTYLNGKIYFTADAGLPLPTSEGRELYYYDIATNQHRLVTNHLLQTLRPGALGSNPRDMMVKDGALYFSATSGFNTAREELYRYDPIADEASGPQMIANVTLNGSSSPRYLTEVDGLVYFTATDNGLATGRELYVYDRNTNTHRMVADLNPGPADSNPQFMTAIDGKIFFSADDSLAIFGLPNRELWCYDTTVPGTSMLKVAEISFLFGSDPRFVAEMDGNLYFSGFRAISLDGSGGVQYTGIELWKYNLTSQEVELVDDISTGLLQNSDPFWMTEANGMLYFGAFTPLNGRELWQSDGENPSTMVGNFNAGAASFLPDGTPPGFDYRYPYTSILKTTW